MRSDLPKGPITAIAVVVGLVVTIIGLFVIANPIARLVLAFIALVCLFVGLLVARRLRHADEEYEGDASVITYAFALSAIPAIVLLTLFSLVRTVPAGHAAVPTTFGKVGHAVGPGVHLASPVSVYHNLNTRQQTYSMVHQAAEGQVAGDDSVNILTQDQANVAVDASVIYRVDQANASGLYSNVGTSYEPNIVRPISRAVIRDSGAGFSTTTLQSDRASFETKVTEAIRTALKDKGLTVDQVLIRNIALPQGVIDAANAKIAALQQAQAKDNQLLAAQKQAEIDRTDAKAKADSQQILACGGTPTDSNAKDANGKEIFVVVPNKGAQCDQSQLSAPYLTLEYIKMLAGLVNSPNHSTLILPSDKIVPPLGVMNPDGSPIITPPAAK